MPSVPPPLHHLRVAVVGAGLSGATCARALADAGMQVRVFDKSRGPGGRLSTRRSTWTSADGAEVPARHDHGTPAFGARSPAFVDAVEQARGQGLLAPWRPRLAAGGYAPLDAPALWVATPDMPAWCRALLADLPLQTGCTVGALQRSAEGWRLEAPDRVVTDRFDAVLVAVPPAQAAPLLRPHHADAAQQLQGLSMRPCWTLMAVTEEVDGIDWDLAWPADGPWACIVRDDAKPGRVRTPGRAHWVAQATAAWSQAHLATPPKVVRDALTAALAVALRGSSAAGAAGGHAHRLTVHHAVVHRWLYASAAPAAPSATRCWWDPASGLGACGDALGGAGVEGAWLSGRALAEAVISRGPGSQALDPRLSSPLAHTMRI